VGTDRRGLLVGLVLVVLLAGAVAVMPNAGRPEVLNPQVVLVASPPGAVVPRPDLGSLVDSPPCKASPSTGAASLSFRVAPAEDWTKVTLPLCQPPGFRPGAVSVSFGSPEGPQFEAVVPVAGWIPYQRWQGSDAQISFRLTGDSIWWLARDADLPCRIRTDTVRQFLAPIAAFEGEPTPDGKVLVGAAVRASFDCKRLPLFKIAGAAPVDLKGELSALNCQGTARVVPPPTLPPGCPDA
jgi:hypothetical protein